LFLGSFKYYNITPIFIFDGKPPEEKKALLKQRKEDKKTAEQEYNCLLEKLHEDIDEETKQEIQTNMDALKKQFVYVSKTKIEIAKDMIRAFGYTYFDAHGEADELCALLVIKKKAWACLSEDMDMFVYGCPRVLRYLSLLQKNVVLYDMKGILHELNLTMDEFREICIISGSDYNINTDNKMELHKTLKYFKKYKKNDNECVGFYNWLMTGSKCDIDYQLLHDIKKMFIINDMENKEGLKSFEQIKIMNGPTNLNAISSILEDDGFIFVY
jgi:flap endonuclease-1